MFLPGYLDRQLNMLENLHDFGASNQAGIAHSVPAIATGLLYEGCERKYRSLLGKKIGMCLYFTTFLGVLLIIKMQKHNFMTGKE